MLYFEDFAGCRGLVSSNTAFLVSDRDFIFETFNALTRKSYFEAEGTISYVDGSDDYTFKTETLTSGFSDIHDLLKGPLCEQFDRIRECSMKVDFVYKYPGECRRDFKARDVRLWYNSITGRMYLSENAKRLLYLSDTLPAVSCALEEMLGHTVFEEVNCAGITESDRSFVSKYLRLFNTRVKDRVIFKGNFFSWPAPPKVVEVLPYLSESNMQRSIAVGVTQGGNLCFLTGDDIRRNVLSSNALGLVYIYTECLDAVTRARWDGTEVCAVPLAIESVSYLKRCLGAVK